MKFLHTKKFRYGSVSLALTVVIIAAVILFNAIFTALSEKFLWYLDMTSEEIYTLSDEAKVLLDEVDPEKEVTIIFCSPRDELEANQIQRYALYTVLEMAEEYDNINIKYVNVLLNPSAVAQYKESSGQTINAYSVIVTCDSDGDPATKPQSRVYALSALYTYDSEASEIVGYNGEQRLVSAVLSVTQVEVPVACYTLGHGENDQLIEAATSGSPILTLLSETGYDVQGVDLATDEIPEDCSLLLIYNPQSDFKEYGDVSELGKLDDFLAAGKAVMFFYDHEMPPTNMDNLDAFLKEWGVEIARYTDAENDTSNYLIQDKNHSYTAAGYTNVATYVEQGLGASLTRQLLYTNYPDERATYPKDVVFPYTSAINCTYEMLWDETNECFYGTYYSNGVTRDWYEVFTSSEDAVAWGGETELEEEAPFTYMSVTRETQADDNYAYLLACASTDFASAGALESGYGNHTVLTRACHVLGGATVSVSLDCKYFADMEINTITSTEANQYTIVLTVVPAAIIFIAGVYIMVRRKYA